VLRFVLVFAAALVAFQLLFLFAISGSAPFARYLELCARAAGALLGWLGQNVYVYENRVTLLPNEFVVTAPCSGLQPMAMLAIAVLAFPSSARAKLAGVVLGIGALFALNLVRIATLCLVQDRWAGAFELFHLALWPMALILCSIALWAAWARRVTRA
jgi:exosortase/archaeosortase family protein